MTYIVDQNGHFAEFPNAARWESYRRFCFRRGGAWHRDALTIMTDLEERDAMLADVGAWTAFLDTLSPAERDAALASRAKWDAALAEEREHARRRQRAATIKHAHRLAETLHLPVRRELLDPIATGEGLLETKPLAAVRAWNADRARPPVLGLFGALGIGKTVAATWALVHRTGDVSYVTADALALLRAARYGDDARAYRQHLEADVLVVDELGAEREQGFARDAIRDVVDARVGGGAAIFVGNVQRSRLGEHLRPRTLDRLLEIGRVVEMAGPSLRRGER